MKKNIVLVCCVVLILICSVYRSFFGVSCSYQPQNNVQTFSCQQKPDIPLHHNRIAIFASYNKNGYIHDYVVYYLKELKKQVDGIIFIMDNPIKPSEFNKIKDLVIYAEFSRHGEYDFGSYKRGFLYLEQQNYYPKIKEIVFVNDSCFGPLYPFSKVWDKLNTKIWDFAGILDCYMFQKHIQSYFYIFKENVFRNPLFKEFLINVKHEKNRQAVIRNYEVKFTKYLNDLGYQHAVYEENPYQEKPKDLSTKPQEIALRNLPFIKVKTIMRLKKRGRLIPFLMWVKHKNPIIFEKIQAYINSNV